MSFKNDQVSESETRRILELARECLYVEGDFVEFGCYRGDTSLLLAGVLWEYNRRFSVEKDVENFVDKSSKNGGNVVKKVSIGLGMKKLWIYDSFEGLPEKSSADESVLGVDFRGGELSVTKREVKMRFLRAGLKLPVIKKGWFADLSPDDLPCEIAFAFLDGDFYESIRDSLRLVVPRMAEGGVLVVHDYTNAALPGVRKAVNEWKKLENGRFRVELL